METKFQTRTARVRDLQQQIQKLEKKIAKREARAATAGRSEVPEQADEGFLSGRAVDRSAKSTYRKLVASSAGFAVLGAASAVASVFNFGASAPLAVVNLTQAAASAKVAKAWKAVDELPALTTQLAQLRFELEDA